MLLITVPSKDFRSTIESLDIDIKTTKIVSCVKGFEEKTGKLMSEILEDDFGVPENNIFILSGPNLSKEISDKELTGTVIAGTDKDFVDQLSKSMSNNYFIPFSNSDSLLQSIFSGICFISSLYLALSIGLHLE